MTKKRDRLQIIHDILKAIQDKNGKIKPTHILYKSNLSHQMLEEYLIELKEKKFITEEMNKAGKMYQITDHGYAYLEKYKLITEFVNSFGLQ